MSSDIRITGERNPIFESLWRCDILGEESLLLMSYNTIPDVDDGFGDRASARVGVKIWLSSWSNARMEKSVAKANDQFSQKLEPQEVDSLVQTPRRNDEAAGNLLRIYLKRFEELSKEDPAHESL